MMDPNKACETCAFGKSGGAADEAKNKMVGIICAASGIPFFCHHTKSGKEYDWQNSRLGPMALPIAERRICQGWKRRAREMLSRGQMAFLKKETPEDAKILRRYQRGLGESAIRSLDHFLATPASPKADKEAARRDLRDALRALVSK
jgi:hypothetical protein